MGAGYYIVCLLTLVAAFLGSAKAQISQLQGLWKADFRDSIAAGTASIVLAASDSVGLVGNYQTNLGGEGNIAVRLQQKGYKFVLTQTTKDCAGSFIGEFGFEDGKITGTYSGTDCNGWHDNGAISMVRREGAETPPSGISTPPSQEVPGRPGHVGCGATNSVIVWRQPGTSEIVEKLRCNEVVRILSDDSSGLTRIRTPSDHEGYVVTILIHESDQPVAQVEAPSVTKEVPADTPLKKPSRIPTAQNPTVQNKVQNNVLEDYPLTIRVLQTDQVPYSVQYGGGGVSTNCSISGSTYTTGSATSVGNYAYGSATSNTNLSMNCNSQENPPLQWRHVLNAMLVVA
jgi:hypothetical protein